jgi:hypothetical protein
MLQSLLPLPALAAALIVGTDRRIVRELRRASATTAEGSIHLAPSPMRRFRLRRLANAGALRLVAGNRYYLDEVGWTRYRRARRAWVLIAAAAAVTLLVTARWLRLL